MRVARYLKTISMGIAVALTAACGVKSDSKNEDTSTEDAAGGGGGASSSNKVGSASNIADLKLAGALAIKLPEAFGGAAGGASLRLVPGKKSQEACMMGGTIKDSVRSIGEVAGFFCHLEVEKDRVKFGKKYKLMTPQGEFAKIYVDNSQASTGKLVIGFCSADMGNGQNRQLITIDALTDAGPKGAIISDGSGTFQNIAMTYAQSTAFDMSVADVVSLISKDKNEHSGNTSVREVALELKKTGLSTLKLAYKGGSSGAEFFDRGIAYMSADKGSAVFQSQGSHQGNNFTFSRRSHFSKTGEVLGSVDVGADLQPAIASMPAFLASNFAPDSPTGWVGNNCPDFDEEVSLDPNSVAHAACDQGRDDNDLDCWDQTKYESSNELVSIQ